MTISISNINSKLIPLEEDVYLLDFGRLFQGRSDSYKGAGTEVLDITTNALLGRAFDIIIPDKEHRFTVYAEKDYVLPNKAGRVSVSVVDYKIGEPNKEFITEDPSFQIHFPSEDRTITVRLNWFNYWAVATVNSPAEVVNKSTATHQMWNISASLASGDIPIGEVVRMEILVDDPDQLPTPIRKLDSDGNYDMAADEAAEVEGRRGVFVEFDATNGTLMPGAVAETEVYVRKGAFLPGQSVYTHFGEHSDKGVYSATSEYLQVGSTGGKLDFSVFPDITSEVLTDKSSTVTWKIKKEIPVGSWDDTVSVISRIPDNSGNLIRTVHVMEKGDMENTIRAVQYSRNVFGQGNRIVTPSIDPDFNERSVNPKTFTSYTILEQVEVIVPDPDPDPDPGPDPEPTPEVIPEVYITDVVGQVFNGILPSTAKIVYSWDSTHAYFTDGGKLSIEGIIVRRDTSTDQIKELNRFLYKGERVAPETFTIADKVNVNYPDLYEIYLYVNSYSEPEGYTPVNYFIKAGILLPRTATDVTFGPGPEDPIINSIPNTQVTYVTNAGFRVIHDFFTKKYYVDGTSTMGTNGQIPVGNFSNLFPAPATNKFYHNVLITPTGEVVYIYGSNGTTYTMDELTVSETVSDTINLKVVAYRQEASDVVVTFEASVAEGIASKEHVVFVDIYKKFSELVSRTTMTIIKDDSAAYLELAFPQEAVSYEVVMEFTPHMDISGYLWGTSPARAVISQDVITPMD